jgi:hypothetical protein
LSKDYEGLTESSQALIYAAMIHIMIRRLAKVKPLAEWELILRHALRYNSSIWRNREKEKIICNTWQICIRECLYAYN